MRFDQAVHRITGVVAVLLVAGCGGGEEVTLPEPMVIVGDDQGRSYQHIAPSPDGGTIAWGRTVAGRSAIFVSDPDGGNPRQLTSGVWDQVPYWSPDGRWIAYQAESPDFDIMLVSADGSESRQLTSGPDRDFPVGWLPDGSGVVFYRGPIDNHVVMVAPLDGSEPRLLTPDVPGAGSGAVSPDGTLFMFEVTTGASGSRLWLMEMATGATRELTSEGYEDSDATWAWSPDSRSIVFTSRRTGTGDLWIADVATGDLRQLTTDLHDDWEARWSPDGRHIAFRSNRGGQTDLWVIPSAGGAARRITNDVSLEEDATWSPDGSTLYYHYAASNARFGVLPLDGGAARWIAEWPDYFVESTALAPDGSRVVFGSYRSGRPDLWLVGIGGGDPAPLAETTSLNWDPEFLPPGGERVLFQSDRGGQEDIWVIDVTGGAPINLTNDAAREIHLEGSPGGDLVAMTTNREGASEAIWVVGNDGSGSRRLTDGSRKPRNLAWAPSGDWLYFVGDREDGGAVAYRVRPVGGPVELVETARGIGGIWISPDGTMLAYPTFEGGFAFIEVVPVDGSAPPRRLTEGTDRWQNEVRWTPDGQRLVVMDLDLEGNRDAMDLWVVDVATGAWSRVTETPLVDDDLIGIVPSGDSAVVVARTWRTEKRAVRMAGVLE